MNLTDQELEFLGTRARLINIWRYVGVFLVVVLMAFAGALFWFVPLLANPFKVMRLLESNSLALSTMAFSAALLPILFLTCILLMFFLLLFVFVSLSNERKYLSILRKLGLLSHP